MQPPFWERACPSHRTGSLRSRYRFRIIRICPNRIKRINRKLTKPDYYAAPWNWRIRDGRLQVSDGDSIRQEFRLLGMRTNSQNV